MIDPALLVLVSGAVKKLVESIAAGTGEEAAKTLWKRIQGLLGSSEATISHESVDAVVRDTATQDPESFKQVLLALQEHQEKPWGQLVGHIEAEKVVVAGHISTLNM